MYCIDVERCYKFKLKEVLDEGPDYLIDIWLASKRVGTDLRIAVCVLMRICVVLTHVPSTTSIKHVHCIIMQKARVHLVQG